MNIVAAVKQIVGEVAEAIPGAEVIAPLAVWDSTGTSMGVQIKAPQDRGGQPCEVTANFVLTREELGNAGKIRIKAMLAVNAVKADIQVQIRPLKPLKEVLEVAHASA
jgi:hypothetical protein